MAGTYKQEISATKNLPGCLIVLLDQSGSMAEQFGADKRSKAVAAARAVNSALDVLIGMCVKGETTRDYYHVGPKLSDSCGRNVHLRIKEAFVLTLLVEWWTERRNCLGTTLFSALNAATWTRKAVLVHTPSVAMADQWVCY